MFNILFFILLTIVFGRIAYLSVRLTWGFTKVLLTLVFLPILLVIGLFLGFIKIAMPILIVVGIVTLFIR